MNILEFLREVPLFKGLPDQSLQILAQHAHWRDYDTGEVIIAEKEALRGLFIQVSGRSKIFRTTSDGREQTIYIFGPGEPFCLCALFADSRQPATATALEPGRVLAISDRDFTDMAEEHPAVIFSMLLIMSRRLKEAMNMIESLSVREIPVRLANFLVHAADESGQYTLPMTHRELAKIIGATPEALSRAFKKLTDYGLLTLDGRNVRILDNPGLKALAGVAAVES